MSSGKTFGRYHSILMGIPESVDNSNTINPKLQQSFDSDLSQARKWAKAVLERVPSHMRSGVYVQIREMQIVDVETVH